MRPDQVTAVLGRTELFSSLNPQGLERVAALSHARTYARGTHIFHQGDAGDVFYVTAAGLVKVYISSEQGDEMVLATLCPPDSFGELAMIDGGPRTASARAMQETTLLTFSRANFLDLVRSEPLIDTALHRSLGKLLRRMLAQAADLVFLDLPGRVAKLLMTLAQEGPDEAGGASVVQLDVNQGDLARMVGGSRPSVNQILRAFEARGYVSIRGRTIVINESQALKHRAGLV